MTTLRSTAATLALAVTATGTMAACSSEKKAPTAKDAYSKAQDSMGKYKTMEIQTSGKSEGKSVDLTTKGDVNGSKEALSGTLAGGHVEAILIDGQTYTKADEAYYKSIGSGYIKDDQAKKLANQWIKGAKSSSTSTTDKGFTKLVKDVRDDNSAANKKLLSDKATVTKDKVGDTDAWKITSEDKKVIAWVSQDDDHDLLKAQGIEGSTSGGENIAYTIKSHDEDYGIKAPSGAKAITDIIK